MVKKILMTHFIVQINLLGIIIDIKLNFSIQINRLCNKVNEFSNRFIGKIAKK